jgi:hypothetical protein
MLKNLTQFKVLINDFECTFNFESNCPIEVAKESILQALKWIGKVEDQAKEQAQLQKEQAEQPPTEDIAS